MVVYWGAGYDHNLRNVAQMKESSPESLFNVFVDKKNYKISRDVTGSHGSVIQGNVQ